MDVKIREYQPSDYKACYSLWGELTQHHADIYEDPTITGDDPGHGFVDYINNPQRRTTWVAELNSQVVAFTGLLVNQEAQIEPIVVSSAYRNKGIGTMLIQHVVQEVKKMDITFLSIRPVARNEKAISLFTRLGFNLIGHVDLFQDLSSPSSRKWKPGITLQGKELLY